MEYSRIRLVIIYSILCCFLKPATVYGQCTLAGFTGTMAPSSGTTFMVWTNYSPGTYFNMPVLSGGSYAISTCGANMDTQISGYNPAPLLVLYNDNNGPLCSGNEASVNNFIPNFTNFLSVQINEFPCLAGSLSSINVFIRQNNNLSITSSSASLCSGDILPLSALPANAGIVPPGYGSPGVFSGTGVSGNVFTAPNVAASTNYTITYTFGFVSTHQVITVHPLPLVSVVASSVSVCLGSSVTLNATGATSYTWTGGVTNGVPFSPSISTTYSVTGSSNGCVSVSQADVNVLVHPTPLVSAVATKTLICFDEKTTLTGVGAQTYTWSGGISNGVPFTPVATFTYSLIGSNSFGCISSNTVFVTVVVNPCIGGEEFLQPGKYTYLVYPNPSSQHVCIEGNSDITIVLTNCDGQIIRTVFLNEANGFKVSLSDLSPGIYFLSSVQSQKIDVKKLIILRD